MKMYINQNIQNKWGPLKQSIDEADEDISTSDDI